jgi:hypothetical protein
LSVIQEFDARAALCRRLAKLEPLNGQLWLAEAEKWSRLAQTEMRGGGRSQDSAPDAVEAKFDPCTPISPVPPI